jgi:hypothetical protein
LVIFLDLVNLSSRDGIGYANGSRENGFRHYVILKAFGQVAFRDYLRAHLSEAKQYADLKRKLAEQHLTDRETYTDSKEQFVREITQKALETFPS